VDDPAGTRPLTTLRIPSDLDASLVLVRHGESELIAQRRFQGHLETPLSPLGRAQAARVAARLARPNDPPALPIPGRPPLAIVHSPLTRAAQTADAIDAAIAHSNEAPIADATDADDAPIGQRPPTPRDGIATGRQGVAVHRRPDHRFTEIGQGDWEGRLASEIAETDGERLAAWRRSPTTAWAPGGEPLADVRERVLPGLADLLSELATAGRPGSILAPQVGGYRDQHPLDHPWTILVAHDGVFKVALLALFDLPLERFWMWTSDLCAISIVEIRAGRPVARAMNLTEHLAGLVDESTRQETETRQRSGAL